MTVSKDHDDVSETFIRMPNELKLMIADELGTHDVNALARACREMYMLLVWFMYRRAKNSRSKSGRPYFLLAVDDGNLTAVERFVEADASVNMTDTLTDLPETAVHSCACFGHVKIAKFLIDNGIDVSAVDSFGDGALHSVVTGVNPEEEMMTLLVESGADVNATPGSFTPLHRAASTGNVRLVQWLLDLGADPNAADRDGFRPLHTAVANSDGAIVRCLLEAGQNIEVADHHGRTPLHVAAVFGSTESAQVLLEMGAYPSSIDRAGSTPILYAVNNYGNEATIHRIAHLAASMAPKIRDVFNDCVPSCQLREENHTIIEMLLEAQSNFAKPNNNGDSPLKWAAARIHTTIFFGPRKRDFLIR